MQNIIITICEQCGDTLVKVCEKACYCPTIIEKATKAPNQETIQIICGTIVVIVAISATTIILWRLIDLLKANSKDRRNRRWMVEDTKREQVAEYRKIALEFWRDPYLATDRKFNTDSTNVNEAHPYIKAVQDCITKTSRNN